MDALTIVEVRDDRGVVTARLKVAEGLVTAGRGPENAIWIDDEFVDGAHLEVTVAGAGEGVLVRDLGTRNGTRIDGTTIRDAEELVAFGEEIGIGQSSISFQRAGATVPEAKALPESEPRAFRYDRIPAWPAAMIVVAYVTIGLVFTTPLESGWVDLVGFSIGAFLVVMIWAGLWAGAGRLFAGRARFKEHLGFVSVLSLVLFPLSTLSAWVAFALDHPVSDVILNWGLFGLVSWGFMLFGHIDIASGRTRRFKVAAAAALASLIIVAVWAFDRREVPPPEQILRSLQVIAPVPPSLTRSTSWENFSEELTDLRASLDDAVDADEES